MKLPDFVSYAAFGLRHLKLSHESDRGGTVKKRHLISTVIVRALLRFFPHNLPTRNGEVVFLNVAADQAAIFKRVGTNLARAEESRIDRHFRQMMSTAETSLYVPTIRSRISD